MASTRVQRLAFNNLGHTDIIVREDNANLFIAECKIWHGQKQFTDAIDQLFGYVTWRDTEVDPGAGTRDRRS